MRHFLFCGLLGLMGASLLQGQIPATGTNEVANPLIFDPSVPPQAGGDATPTNSPSANVVALHHAWLPEHDATKR